MHLSWYSMRFYDLTECYGNYSDNDGRAVSRICHTAVGMAAVQGAGGMGNRNRCQVYFKSFLLIPSACVLLSRRIAKKLSTCATENDEQVCCRGDTGWALVDYWLQRIEVGLHKNLSSVPTCLFS